MVEIVRKQVRAISFSLLSPEIIKRIGTAKIVTPELYDVDGYPVDGGLMDLRLGAIDPGVRCRTCGGGLKECLGHPGSIELARPVLHVKYIPLIELFLRSFCESCGKILLSDEDLKKYPVAMRIKKSKDAKKCPHCGNPQERVKLEKPTTFHIGKRRMFPTEIREKLVRISDEQVKLVGVNPMTCRPEWAVLTLLLVPPVTVRPSITLESGERSEDDLTHKLSDIIRANQRLWENLNAGAPEVIIEDLWDLAQYHVTTFFDNTITRIPLARHRSGQPLKTITERIKGKEGRIRHNLAGKRVNFSSRTVISPDPFLDIDEIGIPFEIAKVITVAESVTTLNLERLKNLILHDGYPGANYIIRPDGKRKRITPELKQEIIEELAPGYIVERHLQDGDVVLFNRHPSLHRASLMSHYVRVLPSKTFRFHPVVGFPYNADFDGDEMNIHSPQTEEARAEAKVLLNVKQNLISPKNACNLLGCIADAVTGNFILGKSEIEKAEAMQLLYNTGIEKEFSKKMIDGKDIFMNALPKELQDEKFGDIDSKLFGVEEGRLVKELDRKAGREVAIETLRKVFALGTSYLSRIGYTISLEDLNVNEKTKKLTDEAIKDVEERAEKVIQSYYDGSLELIPGKSREDSREIKILQVLNEVRTKIGTIVKQEFPKDNAVNKMIMSGAGGNILNITQISCCVGQQSLWNKRIGFGYTGRTLSFFKVNDLSPRARGFIYSYYRKGLRPYEFFFGSITGRDAMMDTALRTPKSGYLYRRLANALQDLKSEYDGTVRDASGNIVQFKYGDDGIDVSTMHLKRLVTPGEAIGMVTAQSFGEPSTQMALNVFHSAGVQEMQITSGLPRLIEIFDARKNPSTPLMEIHLDKEYNNEKDARNIAEKIKEVKLKDIISEIKVNFADKKIEIMLNPESLKHAHTSVDNILAMLTEVGYKLKARGNSLIYSDDKADFKQLYKTKEKMKDTRVSGIEEIAQILVVRRESNYIILTAGTNLEEVFKVKGVNIEKTTTNDIHETANVLGIEAARQQIINEIYKVIESQGLDIDERHLKLVSDAMCTTGEIKGITRMGIISQKSSILARASFETPIKQFVNATIKASRDELASVIENIILNQPVPVGTGLPGLLVKVTGPLVKDKKEKK
jgi:DNA-directed RNA polymerase subunit A'